jgi:hypothetical protein
VTIATVVGEGERGGATGVFMSVVEYDRHCGPSTNARIVDPTTA